MAYLTLAWYMSTRVKNGYSLAELLICQCLRTKLSIVSMMLVPQIRDTEKLSKLEETVQGTAERLQSTAWYAHIFRTA